MRKQAKEHGTKSLIEGLPDGDSLKGKRVVIVEDVTTTGGSAIKAAEAVRAEGAEVVGVVTVIDREEGAGEAFAAAGLTLTADPHARRLQVSSADLLVIPALVAGIQAQCLARSVRMLMIPASDAGSGPPA